jgi:hypothetical protein
MSETLLKNQIGLLHHLSAEHKLKLSEAKKRNPVRYWLGKKMNKEMKLKMSLAKIGKHISPATEFKKGMIPWQKGKKILQMSGQNNPNWKGGIMDTSHERWRAKNKDKVRYYSLQGKIKRRNLLNINGGNHTFKEWEQLKQMHNYTCLYCGEKEPKITLSEDHIIPLSQGGSDNISNIQPLCLSCNHKKGGRILFFYERNIIEKSNIRLPEV